MEFEFQDFKFLVFFRELYFVNEQMGIPMSSFTLAVKRGNFGGIPTAKIWESHVFFRGVPLFSGIAHYKRYAHHLH